MVVLSPREVEILTLLADGQSIPEIAARLDLAEASIRTHIQRAAKKLGTSNITHTVATAIRLRLI